MRISFQTGVTWRARATVRWNTNPFVRTDNFLALEDKIQPALLRSTSKTHTSNPAIVARNSAVTVGGFIGEVSIGIPSGLQIGDMLFFVVATTGSPIASLLYPLAFPLARVSGDATTLAGFYHIYDGAPLTSAKFYMADGVSLSFWNVELFVLRGVDTSVAPEATFGTTGATANPDPGTFTPTFSSGNRNLWISGVRQSGALTASPWTGFPTGWTDTGSTISDNGSILINSFAFSVIRSLNASEDPSAYTSPNSNVATWTTFAIRGGSAAASDLQVRLNYRAVQPLAIDSTNILRAHTVTVAGGTLTLNPPLLTDADSFFNAKIISTLKPTNLASTTTLRAHAVRSTIKPAILTNSQTFPSAKIIDVVKPTALTNAQSFFNAKIITTVKPTNLASTSVLRAHAIRDTIKPALLADADTLYAHTIRATIKPPIHTDPDTLNAHTIRATLKPGLFTDPDVLYAHSIFVAGSNILSPLFTDPDVFFNAKIVATLKPTAFTNSQSFPAAKIVATVKPVNIASTATLRAHAISQTIKPLNLGSTSTLRAHTVSVSGAPITLIAPVLVNDNTLRAHAILTTTTAPSSGSYGGEIRGARRSDFDPAKNREEALKIARRVLWVDLAAPALVNRSELPSHGVVMTARSAEFAPDLGLSPIEIDEITDILDALEAMDALEAIESLGDQS